MNCTALLIRETPPRKVQERLLHRSCNIKKRMVLWIPLNVGGTKFLTTWTVLSKESGSELAKMFSDAGKRQVLQDKDGFHRIDANPKYFGAILQYLRRGEVIIDPDVHPKGVLEEARYFGIQSMVDKMMLMSSPSPQ